MNRFTDYYYAAVPSVCLAIPVAQILPDLSFLQGIEKLGIIGIMAAGIVFFVKERRSFIAKSAERLEGVESRLGILETKIAAGNDKVIHLLGEQLDALKALKIKYSKNGQNENFARMWQLTLRSLNGHNNTANRLQENEDDVLRPEEHSKQS